MHRYILFILVLVAGPSAGFARYQMSDLNVLSREGSHQEFLQHALDIRPSERGEDWQKMVSKMALKYIDSLLLQSEMAKKDFHKIEELYRWPSLRQDDVFKLRRVEFGVRYLKKCINLVNPCWDDLKAFWVEDSSDSDMAIELAELIKDKKDAPYSLWTLLEKPLRSPLAEFYCAKSFVMETLWKKLEMDYIELEKGGDLGIKISHSIHLDCLPFLVKEAKRRVYLPLKTGDRDLAFEVLRATRNASTEVTDFFLTVYLLEQPGKGELMNLAWNNLHHLGKSAQRREEVIEEMKKLSPLPDDLFRSLDLTKKRVILRHFKLNFPEYLDFYSERCVSYYQGKLDVSKGNPTQNCEELMTSDFARDLIPETKILQYQAARKI